MHGHCWWIPTLRDHLHYLRQDVTSARGFLFLLFSLQVRGRAVGRLVVCVCVGAGRGRPEWRKGVNVEWDICPWGLYWVPPRYWRGSWGVGTLEHSRLIPRLCANKGPSYILAVQLRDLVCRCRRIFRVKNTSSPGNRTSISTAMRESSLEAQRTWDVGTGCVATLRRSSSAAKSRRSAFRMDTRDIEVPPRASTWR